MSGDHIVRVWQLTLASRANSISTSWSSQAQRFGAGQAEDMAARGTVSIRTLSRWLAPYLQVVTTALSSSLERHLSELHLKGKSISRLAILSDAAYRDGAKDTLREEGNASTSGYQGLADIHGRHDPSSTLMVVADW